MKERKKENFGKSLIFKIKIKFLILDLTLLVYKLRFQLSMGTVILLFNIFLVSAAQR
jgi:hypothetical protein